MKAYLDFVTYLANELSLKRPVAMQLAKIYKDIAKKQDSSADAVQQVKAAKEMFNKESESARKSKVSTSEANSKNRKPRKVKKAKNGAGGEDSF